MRLNNGASSTNDDAPRVIISWPKGNADDNITAYEVKVLNGDGEFKTHPDCDVAAALDMDEPKCALTMQSFWSGDFQLDQGTYITVSVRAENVKGWSESSRWNTDGATVEKVPSMMNPPSGLRDESNNDVSLEWKAMASPRDGGSEVTTYVL